MFMHECDAFTSTQIQLCYSHLTALFTAILANVPSSLLLVVASYSLLYAKSPGKMHDFIYALISLIDLSIICVMYRLLFTYQLRLFWCENVRLLNLYWESVGLNTLKIQIHWKHRERRNFNVFHIFHRRRRLSIPSIQQYFFERKAINQFFSNEKKDTQSKKKEISFNRRSLICISTAKWYIRRVCCAHMTNIIHIEIMHRCLFEISTWGVNQHSSIISLPAVSVSAVCCGKMRVN